MSFRFAVICIAQVIATLEKVLLLFTELNGKIWLQHKYNKKGHWSFEEVYN